MKKLSVNTKGFTLIEIIAALLLLAVASAIAGMGIVSGIQAYIFSRINNELVQKAQIATTRIKLDLMNMDSVTATSAAAITFTSIDTPGSPCGTSGITCTIAQSGNQITYTITGGASAGTYVLLDNVGAGATFLSYSCIDNTCTGSSGSWQSADPFRNLKTVAVNIPAQRPDGSTLPLLMAVNPRRNGVTGAPKALN
jgi:prepilin-type N-terminal cleavage/methylation domain-containing protein